MFRIYSKMLHKNACNLCCQSFHNSSIVYQQNYYKILNLKNNCTDREIRDSFVKLSKECHPDTSKDVNKENTIKFQQILEAYRVLSKPQSRLVYDLNLTTPNQFYNTVKYTDNRNYYAPFKHYHHPSSNPSQHYYGVRGIKKISNTIIVIGIFCIIGLGVAIQLYLIRNLMAIKRDRLLTASDVNNETYDNIRANAKLQRKEEHLKRLIDSEKYR